MIGHRFFRDVRGQTPTDFVIGVSLFLATVAVVLSLAPVLFTGGVGGVPPDAGGADRAVEHLKHGVLAGTGDGALDERGSVSRACTIAFFDASSAPASAGCAYDSSRSLPVLVGVPESHAMTVTVVDQGGDTVTVDGVELSRSHDAPGTEGMDSVVVTRSISIVGVGEDPVRLRVTVTPGGAE